MSLHFNFPQTDRINQPHDLLAYTFLTGVESDLRLAITLGGIHGALAYLNARTRYRFTGIHPMPHGGNGSSRCPTALYDRETPAMACADFRDLVHVTRCIAQAEGIVGVDPMANSPTDPHFPPECAAPRVMAGSRVGTHLAGPDGRLSGILCHFDFRLRNVPPSEVSIMQFLGARAGSWIGSWVDS